MSGQFLSNEDLARRYGVPLATVRKWRHEGTGPAGMKLGRHVRYRASDVEAWESAHCETARKAS